MAGRRGHAEIGQHYSRTNILVLVHKETTKNQDSKIMRPKSGNGL